MKKLIIINGTMGVGKTTTSYELQKMLPQNVLLDGDWCWNMNPFIVNDEICLKLDDLMDMDTFMWMNYGLNHPIEIMDLQKH